MKLAPGARLGPYEIVSPLGAGGMGEVYRARDTRLGRDVAIKVLPTRFAADTESLRRFELEARAAAALEHPSVVAVYDVGVEAGSPYLVTELLSGGTLRERLQRGRPPLAETLVILRALLDALGEAHARGIVHRDLKPENVFLTRDGRVKLLDFGIAKLIPPAGQAADGTGAVTETRQALGTAGYMAPEQVRGEPADHRADLFAIGAMLYEMLTGERAFHGDGTVDTLHAMLHREPPPVSSKTPGLPQALDAIVERCLAKQPPQRFQSAKDLAFAIGLAGNAVPAGSGAVPGNRGSALLRTAPLAALAIGVALAAWALFPKRAETAAPPSGWAAGVLTPVTVDPGYEGQGTLSPDGETVAYTSDRSGNFEIYLQQVGGGGLVNVSNHAADDVQPAFSPDGRQLAFVSTRTSRLDLIYRSPGAPMMGGDVWVMPSLGGMARRVAEDGNFPTWSPDGKTIYFVRARWFRPEIRRVEATGGASVQVPVELPSPFVMNNFQQTHVSPDGRRLLFSGGDQIFTVPVEGGRATPLAIGRGATWDASGRAVLYGDTRPGRNSGLWRIPLTDGAAAGTPEPLLVGPEGCDSVEMDRSGRRIVLTTHEVAGNLEELPLDAETGVAGSAPRRLTRGANDITFFTVSPDGRSQIYTNTRGAAQHLWRVDDGGEPVQLTTDPQWSESFTRWSPDGTTVAFTRRSAGTARSPNEAELWVMAPDGGSQRRVVEHGGHMSWLPGGRIIYINAGHLRIVEVATGRDEPFDVRGPEPMPIFAASPDGQWIVYQSSVKDKGVDIAIASIPGGEGRWLVRTDKEDYHASFAPSGRWVYFQIDHRNIWRVPGPAQGWREAPPEQVTFMNEPGLFPEDPQLSADGKRLFYSKVQTRGDLWMVELPKR